MSYTINRNVTIPPFLQNLVKGLELFAEKTLTMAGTVVEQAVKREMERPAPSASGTPYPPKASGRMQSQVKRGAVMRSGSKSWIDVEVIGDRQIVSFFLEHGTTGKGKPPPARFIVAWMRAKGIAKDATDEERSRIAWAIAYNLSGLTQDHSGSRKSKRKAARKARVRGDWAIPPKRIFGRAADLVTPQIDEIIGEAVKQFFGRAGTD